MGIQSAGIVPVPSDLRMMAGVHTLSSAFYRKLIQNLVWAAGYTIDAIPLAAGVLAPIGVTISSAVTAVLMSLSTIIVALNTQLVRRLHIRPSSGENQLA